MIRIYEGNNTDWRGNGLCILQPSSCIVSEIAGGDFSLKLVHPITEDLRWKELQEERIIKAPVPAYKPLEDDGTVIVPAEQATEQCFRIYSVSVDTANHEVTVEARHISYDFMGNMCGRLSIQVGTYVVNALTKMRESLMYPDGRILATNIVRRVSLGDRSFVNPIKYLLDPDIGLVQRSRARLVRNNADFYLLDNDDSPDRGYAIANTLNDEHIPSPRGVHWYPSAIQAMLRSEKYKGCLLLQKTFYEDHLSKRQRKNRGEREQYQVENAHEAIVSADDFHEVQAEIARRAERAKPAAGKGTRLFTGKLTCGLCGKEFAWKANSGNPIWICKTFLFRRKEGCPARRISERVLVPILSLVLGIAEADLPGELGRIENITVYPDGRLLITADGTAVEMPWENPSRAASWTPEMRVQAALDVGKRYQK